MRVTIFENGAIELESQSWPETLDLLRLATLLETHLYDNSTTPGLAMEQILRLSPTQFATARLSGWLGPIVPPHAAP